VDSALHGKIQEGHLDQPVSEAGLGLHGVDPSSPGLDRGQDVSAYLAGVGGWDEISVEIEKPTLAVGSRSYLTRVRFYEDALDYC